MPRETEHERDGVWFYETYTRACRTPAGIVRGDGQGLWARGTQSLIAHAPPADWGWDESKAYDEPFTRRPYFLEM